jgi:hypothetical protein
MARSRSQSSKRARSNVNPKLGYDASIPVSSSTTDSVGP